MLLKHLGMVRCHYQARLQKTDYVMGGMDNSDYADKSSLSGTEGSHYAAPVLFQDATINHPQRKPSVSSTGLHRSDPLRRTQLKCQEVPAYIKPFNQPALQNDMFLVPENSDVSLLDVTAARHKGSEREFLITLLRLGPDSHQHDTPTWAAIHTLVSSAVVPLMRVGFIPVIPKPITDPATVRQALVNFQSVRRQMSQDTIAVRCDEAVYAVCCSL